MRKDVFIDKYEYLDMMEDQNNFLSRIEDLKLYMVRFEKNSIMKPKIYSFDCAVGGNNCRPIIVITHNKCTLFANDSIQNA